MMDRDEIKQLNWETFGHLTEPQIMALTIYGEARGESHEGKIAVGTIILERVDKKSWMGKTIHEVCLCPSQFSCFLPADANYQALKLIAQDWQIKAMRSMTMSECYNVADGLITGRIERNKLLAGHHCTQYKTVTAKTKWAKKMRLLTIIGNHEFYV